MMTTTRGSLGRNGLRDGQLAGVAIRIVYPGTEASLHRTYLLGLIARQWQMAGASVRVTAPVAAYPAKDAVVVHIDRSVVPDSMLAPSRGHACAFNNHAADIRKSTYVEYRVHAGSTYHGPVIVKTDLNHAGWPERRQTRIGGIAAIAFSRIRRLLGLSTPILRKSDYQVYASAALVPKQRYTDGSLIQQFLPERMGSQYVLREYYFLGDREFLNVEVQDTPIINSGTSIEYGPGTPPDEVLAVRQQLRLDYGKIDYAIVDGRPVIYDANKTMGMHQPPSTLNHAIAEHLAPGILRSL